MYRSVTRRLQVARVKPGDGSRLKPYRAWQLFSRSLFTTELPDGSGQRHVYAVDVRHLVDSSSSKSPALLYRDGVQTHRAGVPVSFPVPGGVIEVAKNKFGLRRMHYVGDDGSERMLRPDPRSQEGLRARFDDRFPRTSAAVGVVGMVVLLVAVLVALSTGAEQITRIAVVAEHVGVFTSPLHLPLWAKAVVTGAGVLAALDRALRLKSTWMATLH